MRSESLPSKRLDTNSSKTSRILNLGGDGWSAPLLQCISHSSSASYESGSRRHHHNSTTMCLPMSFEKGQWSLPGLARACAPVGNVEVSELSQTCAVHGVQPRASRHHHLGLEQFYPLHLFDGASPGHHRALRIRWYCSVLEPCCRSRLCCLHLPTWRKSLLGVSKVDDFIFFFFKATTTSPVFQC